MNKEILIIAEVEIDKRKFDYSKYPFSINKATKNNKIIT